MHTQCAQKKIIYQKTVIWRKFKFDVMEEEMKIST